MTDSTENNQGGTEFAPLDGETYIAMLDEYLERPENKVWIERTALVPLVFHLRKLCRQLDNAGPAAPAALSSAYLKAFANIDKFRPDAKGTPTPGQTSIFDELD